MTRKISFLLILLIALSLASSSWAYEAVVLKGADVKPYDDALTGFKSACDCSVTTLTASGSKKGAITSKIKRLHPDMVLAIGMDALSIVRSIRDRPIVYVMVPPPLSHAPKESNISGVSMYISPSKYLASMTRLFPAARKIGLVYDPKSSEAYVREALKAAAARGMDLVAKKADTAAAVPSVMDSFKDIDIFWMLPEVNLLNSATVDYILLFSFEKRVPVFTFSKKYVDMGAAAALVVDPFDMGAQAGAIARKLEGGGVSGPRRVDANVSGVLVNRKVLDKLGIRLNKKTLGWMKNDD